MLIVAPFALIAIFSAPTIQEESGADFLLDALAWMIFFVGATFRWWATLYVGGRKEQELAVEGPYSVCRNPLYLGTFLIAFSIPVFLHNLIFAVGLAMAAPMYLWVTVPWEEERLLARFGDRFDAYRKRVPKIFPNLAKFQSPPTFPVNVSGLIGEYRIALRWIWVPLLAEGAAHMRMESWWPHLFHLP